jgi:hypothetical protein
MNARHAADATPPLDIIFTTTQVTPTEVAAVTAVVTAVLDEQASGQADAPTAPSAWQRSQRSLRKSIEPGPGAWRGFSAGNF